MREYRWNPAMIQADWTTGIYEDSPHLFKNMVDALLEKRAPLVAFTGYGNVGKDEAAKVLIELGYQRCAFGDIIKRMSQDASIACPNGILDWMAGVLAGADCPIKSEMESAFLDFNRRGMGLAIEIHNGLYGIQCQQYDPFSEQDEVKKRLRPALEWLGMWRYGEILEEFVSYIKPPAVNTRLMRVAEGKIWKDNGGKIFLIHKPGVAPQTAFENNAVQTLMSERLIDNTIFNDGSREDLWKNVLTTVCLW